MVVSDILIRRTTMESTRWKAHKAPEFQRLGAITCYGETDGLEIGSINKAVQQLGRIACTEGTLPSEKWEIAAQASIFKA